jgi:predicted regulator of Ras-like GTPase activity (Roadblock/LC7/MglB family)
MRSLEPWVEAPLAEFLRESSADLILVMTSAGQVVAQHGFTRSVDVMAVAALGAAIVASTGEVARLMGAEALGYVVHQGRERGVVIAPFLMPGGRWIALARFGPDSTIGLVTVFLARLADTLRAAAPRAEGRPALLAEQFEAELNASLRALFGR